MTCPVCKSSCALGLVLSNGMIVHQNCYKHLIERLETTKREAAKLEDDVHYAVQTLQQSKQVLRGIIRFLSGGASSELIELRIFELKKQLEIKENQFLSAKLTAASIFDLMTDYPPDWADRVSAVKIRDSICVSCRKGGFLHVHHKVPLSKGGSNKISNLCLLCADCHKKEHGGRVFRFQENDSVLAFPDRVAKIKFAISHGSDIEFLYKKPEDLKYSKRTIRPEFLKEYQQNSSEEKTLCIEGFCYKRQSKRVFALKRMKALKIV